MGYAASWITEWYAYDRRVLDALGLAANERIAGFVHIGRPAKPPEDRDRPKLADIVTRYAASSRRILDVLRRRQKRHGLRHDPFKAIVAPRPIGWITSMSAKGEINLAPYSYFNGVSNRPNIVMFSSEGRKDSVAFVEETGEFVCSLTTWDLRDEMNATAAPLGAASMRWSGRD